MQPRHADAVADFEFADLGAESLHGSDDLVAGDDRQFRSDLAFDGVQIGVTNAAGAHAHKNLVGLRFGYRQVGQLKR